MEPLFLKDKAEVTAEEAQQKAETFFDIKKGVLSKQGEVGGKVPAYIFGGKDDNGEIYIQVTKAGGEILYMSRTADRQSSGLTREGAMERAKQFLDETVFRNEDTYTQPLRLFNCHQLCNNDKRGALLQRHGEGVVALDQGNIIDMRREQYL
jgi:hypothetical protein